MQLPPICNVSPMQYRLRSAHLKMLRGSGKKDGRED
jgi:hypothetical protein